MTDEIKLILERFGGRGYLIIKDIPHNNKKVEIEIKDTETGETIKPPTQVKKEWYKIQSTRKSILKETGITDEKTIAKVVEYIEELYRNKQQKEEERKKQEEEAKEEEEQAKEEADREIHEKALKLLKNPGLFYELGKDMEQGVYLERYSEVRYILGEEDVKRLVPILAFTGRRREKGAKQLGIQLHSEGSSTCKDTLAFMTQKLFHLKTEEMGSVTNGFLKRGLKESDADIYYYPEDYTSGYNEITRLKRQMRPGDAGIVSKYLEQVADETGAVDFERGESYTPAKTFIATTNAEIIDRANAAVTIRLKMDESRELTRRVIQEEFNIDKRIPITEERVKVWQRASDIITDLEIKDEDIVIPYKQKLSLLVSDRISDTRRLPKIIKQFIRTIALWRWYQKPEDKRNEADIVDLFIAFRLGEQIFTQTAQLVDKNEKAVYDALKMLVVKETDAFSVKQIADVVGLSETTVNQCCRNLYHKGLIFRKQVGKPYFYYVSMDDVRKNDAFLILPYAIRKDESFNMKEAISEVQSFLFAYSRNRVKKFFLSFIDPIKGKPVKYLIEEKPEENIDLIFTVLAIKKIFLGDFHISNKEGKDGGEQPKHPKEGILPYDIRKNKEGTEIEKREAEEEEEIELELIPDEPDETESISTRNRGSCEVCGKVTNLVPVIRNNKTIMVCRVCREKVKREQFNERYHKPWNIGGVNLV